MCDIYHIILSLCMVFYYFFILSIYLFLLLRNTNYRAFFVFNMLTVLLFLFLFLSSLAKGCTYKMRLRNHSWNLRVCCTLVMPNILGRVMAQAVTVYNLYFPLCVCVCVTCVFMCFMCLFVFYVRSNFYRLHR